MKLFDAVLCLDCDELVDRKEPACPSCTGTILFPVTEWLTPISERAEIELVHVIGKELE